MALVLGTNVGFVTVAPTADPAGSSSNIDNRAWITRDVSPATAIKIIEMGWYDSSSSGTEESNFEVGLYADDGAVVPGEAGTLLEVSRTNAKGTGAGWHSVTGLDWAINSSTDYWFGVQVDNTATATKIDFASSGGSGADVGNSQSTLADPFGQGALGWGGIGMSSIYVVWEAAAAGTNMQLNIGDAWKTVDGMQINIGDAWKAVAGAQINIGDAWKTIF